METLVERLQCYVKLINDLTTRLYEICVINVPPAAQVQSRSCALGFALISQETEINILHFQTRHIYKFNLEIQSK